MTHHDRPQQNSNESFAHAVATLGFADVLETIASKCRNDGARTMIRQLRPGRDVNRIRGSLAEIGELRRYREANGALAIEDTAMRRWIEGAVSAHDPIPPDILLAIAAAERAVAGLLRSMAAEEDYPLLGAIVAAMMPHRGLVDAIDAALERDGTIRNNASRALKTLRKRAHAAKEHLRAYTDRLASDIGAPEGATFNGSRYMLLVPREKCKRKGGIVHSTSHSGGSLYFEPLSLVEKNNNLETILLDERAEEGRILAELVRGVVESAPELLANLESWEVLDAMSACARFSAEFHCVDSAISSDGTIRIVDGRHPLLELSLREVGSAPVPLNICLDGGARVVVITGPNAGGKTVTLKTIGLLTLMFQSGLPVPAAIGTELCVFHNIFADIGDEQSIASSLSTFTSHLHHLDAMCRLAGADSLCLIDEIGDGTDPDEGAALAMATLERLLARSAAVVASTHYGKIKAFALRTDGVSNASMVFDDDNNEPLYRLLQGSAGRSRGLETARRLDYDPPVLERALSLVGEEAFRLESLLADLESSRLALEGERAALSAQSETLNRLVESYTTKERHLTEYEATQKQRAREAAGEMLRSVRAEIEGIVRSIRESDAEKAVVREGQQRLKKLIAATRPHEREVAPARARRVVVGDWVSLSPSGQPAGQVVGVERSTVTIDIHGKRINARHSNLYAVAKEGLESSKPAVNVHIEVEPLQSTTLDVRGQTREEALAAVDEFVDRAVLNGVNEIKIIHGIGEGVLMQALGEHLRRDSRVKSLRAGEGREGGAGVSFVILE